MNRLRQMDSVAKGTISGESWYYYGGIWRRSDPYPVTGIKHSGTTQSVYDQYAPRPAKDGLNKRQKRRLSNKLRDLIRANKVRSVPMLQDVQMSKINFSATPGNTLVKYEFKSNPLATLKATGVNAGYVPLSYCVQTAYKPPNAVSFIQVDSKWAGYLLQRAYSKMSSPQYNMGVTVGEVAETAAMLAGPLRGIAKLSTAAFAGISHLYNKQGLVAFKIAKTAKRWQIKRLLATSHQHPIHTSLRIVDESANHWLAYKFGVLPFVEDVGNIINFKEKSVTQLTGLQTARVKGPALDETFREQGVNALFYTGSWYMSYLLVKRSIDQHYCGLYFRNKVNAPIVNFLENVGFAPWQLPSLAYELIPLSFVVDRFIDVKSFIRGNIGDLSKETFGNFVTRKVSIVYSSTVNRLCWGGIGDVSELKASQPLSASATYDQMVRVVNVQRPKFPVVNPIWREQLIADATNLSLIWGRLRTHVGKSTE